MNNAANKEVQMGMRKQFNNEFKVKVAVEAMKNEKTSHPIAIFLLLFKANLLSFK